MLLIILIKDSQASRISKRIYHQPKSIRKKVMFNEGLLLCKNTVWLRQVWASPTLAGLHCARRCTYYLFGPTTYQTRGLQRRQTPRNFSELLFVNFWSRRAWVLKLGLQGRAVVPKSNLSVTCVLVLLKWQVTLYFQGQQIWNPIASW